MSTKLNKIILESIGYFNKISYENLGKINGLTLSNSSEFITEWTTTSDGETITLPLNSGNGSIFNCTVNWGDTSSSSITSATDPDRIHTYTTAGTYQVKISGTCEGWSFNDAGDKLKIKKVINWGSSGLFSGFKYLENGFFGCTNLTEIPNQSIKASGTGCLNFNLFFANCSSLSTLYTKIFNYHINCTSFAGSFSNCTSLTTIPTDLFRYNTAVTGFASCFQNCTSLITIPTDLFRYNAAATGYSQCFFHCTSLVTIPTDLFRYNAAATGFTSCFQDCTSLTTIPTDLFRYNTAVTRFDTLFAGCDSLVTIPTDLFRYNTAVTSFNGCFIECPIESIASNFFKYNILVTDFNGCFYSCLKLQINRNIFYADGEQSTRFLNKSVNFTNCFIRTSFTGTQGEAPDLWNCTFGTGTPTKTGCWAGAGNSLTSISNYASIPSEWR